MTGAREASAREARYRRLLHCYPAAWRDRNEAAILGVLLDVAEADGRSGPTPREVLDLAARGLLARALAASADGVRGRVAGIAIGFSVVYAVLFVGPAVAEPLAAHAGPAAILLAWTIVGVVVLRQARAGWRVAVLGIAALLPVLLIATRVEEDPFLPDWARPSDATAVLLLGLGLLAMTGPIDRRLMLRTAGIAVLGFAAGFWGIGAWRDPYDQSLWGTPDRAAIAAPGTLQVLWGSGSGRMPLAQDDAPRTPDLVLEWLQGTVLRLDIVTVGAVLAAVVVGIVLLARGRSVAGRVLLLIACPFVAALIVCASRWVVWFQ